jgi:hypothetical protein
MTLFICGSVNPENTKKTIESLFSSLSIDSNALCSQVSPHSEKYLPQVGLPSNFVSIFQHELVSQFSFTLNVLDQMQPLTKLKDIQMDTVYSIISKCKMWFVTMF